MVCVFAGSHGGSRDVRRSETMVSLSRSSGLWREGRAWRWLLEIELSLLSRGRITLGVGEIF
jgi:hypothetical protein